MIMWNEQKNYWHSKIFTNKKIYKELCMDHVPFGRGRIYDWLTQNQRIASDKKDGLAITW